MSTRIAIVGGGITGLTCALRLQQPGREVVLFEASERLGGKIVGGTVGGIHVEQGPDAFLPRDDAPLDLLRELGIQDTRSPAVFGAYIWHRDKLCRVPPGSPYGIPRSPADAQKAGLLSSIGAVRASLERFHRKPLSGPDVSVGSFVRSRFGNEVVGNLVDPLLVGVRGGRAHDTSLAAAAKEIDDLARSNGSVLKELQTQTPSPPGFVTPEGGMQRVVEELASRVDDVRMSSQVSAIEVGERRVTLEVSGEQESVDGVVLACPPFIAADILRGTAPDIAADLQCIEYSELAVVTLVYPPGTFDVPAGGSGFLVPPGGELAISACTWYSTKWPHVTSDGRQVVRCVIGDLDHRHILDNDDAALVDVVHRDLRVTLDVAARPLSHRVTRWEQATPQYRVGHLDLVDSIETRLARLGPILLAGAGYRGSGIPDCIAQANAAAERMTRLVSTGRG